MLTGTVDSVAKKSKAEDAAKNVTGVKVVVGQIEGLLSLKFNKQIRNLPGKFEMHGRQAGSRLFKAWQKMK